MGKLENLKWTRTILAQMALQGGMIFFKYMIHPLQSAIPWTHWSQFIGLYYQLISSDAQWEDKKM